MKAIYSVSFWVFSIVSLFFNFSAFLMPSIESSWCCIELSVLFAVPTFCYTKSGYYDFKSLFKYLIVVGLASGFLVLGYHCISFFSLFIVGFLVKYGVFPFICWIYDVFNKAPWTSIFLISVILKLSVILLCFTCSHRYSFIAQGLISSTLVMLGVSFWVFSINWRTIWCHMMLSSTCVVLAAAFYCNASLVQALYTYYICWSAIIIILLSLGESRSGAALKFYVTWIYFIFVFISLPVTVVFVYKVICALCITSSGYICCLAWCFYSISEQFYHTLYFFSVSKPRKFGSVRCSIF